MAQSGCARHVRSEREQAEDSRVQSAPHRPGLRGIKGGQNMSASEVPAVEERGVLEEVAGALEIGKETS